MSTKVFAPVVVACLFLSVGCGGEIVVRTAPPPERVEAVAAPPSGEHFWVKGHWHWTGRDYTWEPGRWEVKRAGAVWQGGRWREQGGGWVWQEGRWVDR